MVKGGFRLGSNANLVHIRALRPASFEGGVVVDAASHKIVYESRHRYAAAKSDPLSDVEAVAVLHTLGWILPTKAGDMREGIDIALSSFRKEWRVSGSASSVIPAVWKLN